MRATVGEFEDYLYVCTVLLLYCISSVYLHHSTRSQSCSKCQSLLRQGPPALSLFSCPDIGVEDKEVPPLGSSPYYTRPKRPQTPSPEVWRLWPRVSLVTGVSSVALSPRWKLRRLRLSAPAPVLFSPPDSDVTPWPGFLNRVQWPQPLLHWPTLTRKWDSWQIILEKCPVLANPLKIELYTF